MACNAMSIAQFFSFLTYIINSYAVMTFIGRLPTLKSVRGWIAIWARRIVATTVREVILLDQITSFIVLSTHSYNQK